jgi:DNA polymerase-3 subunit alpha
LIAKGALLALRAKVQQEDEGFKLLAEEVALLSAETLRALLQRRSTAAYRSYSAGRSASAGAPPRGAAPASRAGGAATGPAGRPAGGAAAPATPAPAAAPAPGSGQRVFIKITPAAENAAQLSHLKELLQNHPGPVATILFYERDQKLLALSDNYRIKPSEELIAAIESMLGTGTVRIK